MTVWEMVINIEFYKSAKISYSAKVKKTEQQLSYRKQIARQLHTEYVYGTCDVYVGGKVRVAEFMIFLDLQHRGSK